MLAIVSQTSEETSFTSRFFSSRCTFSVGYWPEPNTGNDKFIPRHSFFADMGDSFYSD